MTPDLKNVSVSSEIGRTPQHALAKRRGAITDHRNNFQRSYREINNDHRTRQRLQCGIHFGVEIGDSSAINHYCDAHSMD